MSYQTPKFCLQLIKFSDSSNTVRQENSPGNHCYIPYWVLSNKTHWANYTFNLAWSGCYYLLELSQGIALAHRFHYRCFLLIYCLEITALYLTLSLPFGLITILWYSKFTYFSRSLITLPTFNKIVSSQIQSPYFWVQSKYFFLNSPQSNINYISYLPLSFTSFRISIFTR